jgi:threonine/homoserine/homoserine lactone efflux protein
MPELHPIFIATLAGFICALIFAAIPVGPINLTILNEGAQKGFVWTLFIGLGAAVMDTAYCGLSFTGLSSFLDHGIVKASLQVASFVFLLFLGFKFLLAQSVQMHTRLDHASEVIEARLEQKFHPHSAFMTGVVRVGANLGVLVAWVVLSASLMAHDWVDATVVAKTACVVGVFLGTLFWFVLLGYAVSRSHGRFSEKTLLRVQHVSGLCLITTALFEGVRIVIHLSNQRI